MDMSHLKSLFSLLLLMKVGVAVRLPNFCYEVEGISIPDSYDPQKPPFVQGEM